MKSMKSVVPFMIFAGLFLSSATSAQAASATIISVSNPSPPYVGNTKSTVTVRVQNTGDSRDLRVYFNTSWTCDEWHVDGVYIQRNMSSGTTSDFAFHVTPPAAGGTETVRIDVSYSNWGIWTAIATTNKTFTASAAPGSLDIDPKYWGVTPWDNKTYELFVDGVSKGTGTARKTFSGIAAGSRQVKARITLGSYQADTKIYTVTVTAGQTAYRDVFWDKANLNVTVNGTRITSGYTVTANGQSHNLLDHTVIGDGQTTSYVVTYGGQTRSDAKTYGDGTGLDFPFPSLTVQPRYWGATAWDNLPWTLYVDGAAQSSTTGDKTVMVTAGSHTIYGRIMLGSYVAQTKTYTVNVPSGGLTTQVWWDKVNLNVTVNGTRITSGYTVTANGQSHNLLDHTVIGDGQTTSYVVTYGGQTRSDAKTYGDGTGLDFPFPSLTVQPRYWGATAWDNLPWTLYVDGAAQSSTTGDKTVTVTAGSHTIRGRITLGSYQADTKDYTVNVGSGGLTTQVWWDKVNLNVTVNGLSITTGYTVAANGQSHSSLTSTVIGDGKTTSYVVTYQGQTMGDSKTYGDLTGLDFPFAAMASAQSATPSKSTVYVGETFTVTVAVKNTGNAAGTFNVGLELDVATKLQKLTSDYTNQSFAVNETRTFPFNIKVLNQDSWNSSIFYGKAKITGHGGWDSSVTNQVTVAVDTTPPTISGLPGISWSGNNFTVTVTISDSGSGVREAKCWYDENPDDLIPSVTEPAMTLISGDAASGQWRVSNLPSTAGHVKYRVKAWDNASQYIESPEQDQWFPDTTPPTISNWSVTTVNSKVRVEADIIDASGLQAGTMYLDYDINPILPGSPVYGRTVTMTLVSGNHYRGETSETFAGGEKIYARIRAKDNSPAHNEATVQWPSNPYAVPTQNTTLTVEPRYAGYPLPGKEWDNKSWELFVDNTSQSSGTGNRNVTVTVGNHNIYGRITLGNYVAQTKTYTVNVPSGGLTTQVWWDKVNLNVTVNGSSITSGYTVTANGQSHNLLDHTVIGDGQTTSYVVTYGGQNKTDSKTYGDLTGLDFPFSSETQALGQQILVPTIGVISAPTESFPFPIRIIIRNSGAALTTPSRIRIRGNHYEPSFISISEAGPDTALFDIVTGYAHGFDFNIPTFPANTTIELKAHLIFHGSVTNQPVAGRMLWEIQGNIGSNLWPSVSGEPAGSLWASGLSGKVWRYETAIFPTGLPADTSGVDVQGACPTAISIGNGVFTANLSKEGKIVFAAYPTVGSYTQIPYETRPWDFCAKNLTATLPNDDWAHDFGAPFPTGVFPGIRAIPLGANRANVSWLIDDEWNRRGWTPRHPKHASPTGTQTYRNLDERFEIQETAVVPFGSHAMVRIFDIKNLSSDMQTVSPLCSALLSLNTINQNPYLAEPLVDNVLNWNWQGVTSLNSNGQLLVFHTNAVNDVYAVIGARWLSDPVSSPSLIQGVKARYLEAGIARDITRNAGWDTYNSHGALAEIGDAPLDGNDIDTESGFGAPAAHQGVVEWQGKAIISGGTNSVALVLAFGRTEEDAKSIATAALFSTGTSASALPDQVDDQWESWLQTTEWGAIDADPSRKGLSPDEPNLLARCLVTIHMLQNQPPSGSPYSNALGAIIASPNLSPKYYPVWPRDAFFQSLALQMAGLNDDAEYTLSWMFRSHIKREELLTGNLYWSQAYNPYTGEGVGLPALAILGLSGSILGGGWDSLVKASTKPEYDVVEKDQVGIAIFGALKFFEKHNRLPNGVTWIDIDKACRFLIGNAKQASWMPVNERLLEPSIDFGEEPRNDTGFWQFGNMTAVKALSLAAQYLTGEISGQCAETSEYLNNGLESYFWDPNGELYDKLVFRLGYTINPLIGEPFDYPVANVKKSERLQKVNTFYYWPFALYPSQTTNDLGMKAFVNFTDFVWPIHDLGDSVIEVDGKSITRAQWSVTLLSSVITSRLLGNRPDWPGSDQADYLLNKIIGNNAQDTYLTEAGYVPDVFVAGFPGAAASSVPLGWSHAMMAIALLQKAGYALPFDQATGDITGDGKVDYTDLKLMADQWLSPPGIPSADIAPSPNGDGIVNFLDFALFATHWLEGI